MGRITAGVLVLVIAVLAGVAAADSRPWRPRRVEGLRPNHQATARIAPEDWPQEPSSPRDVTPEGLAAALRLLCEPLPRERARRYAEQILAAVREHGGDPFLVGALIYQQSRCLPNASDGHGVGLSLIQPRMYAANVRGRTFSYAVNGGGSWVTRALRLERFPFIEAQLARAEANLHFTALLLKMWSEQHPAIDAAFEQVAHRHHVSHFVWGDRVRSDCDEDRILVARRRLLQYYGAIGAATPLQREGVMLGAPLDGAPRLVTSGLGTARDGGGRSHRGVDVEAVFGEPVRAVADGRVVFAGVDLPGHRNNQQLSAAEIAGVPRRELGAGGRYVCVLHPRAGMPGLRSCYMHLETVEVSYGQTVARGERVGVVGRTGMEASAPHLHFELHSDGSLLDPRRVLDGLLLGSLE